MFMTQVLPLEENPGIHEEEAQARIEEAEQGASARSATKALILFLVTCFNAKA